jgi:hypothetical protein
MQSGYVVLKSGKRLEGKISLHGSSSAVNEIEFEGDGKELKFPAASLKSYGLTNVNPNASTSTAAAAVNDSPESMYETWRKTCTELGLVPITPAAGDVCDFLRHEAVGREPSSEVAADTILRVAQVGWEYQGKILRPAKVIVASS